MSKSLSLLLVLLFVTIGHARADPLTEDMTKPNAQWVQRSTIQISMPCCQCMPPMPV